jgi:leader peptidase (prepilin peptidase)/N-methyltransferase
MIDDPLLWITFVFGACIGSFLNVCIFRIPENKSIVYPGSACPLCGYRLKSYDNIPIISFLWLRGKCRNCKSIIALRYPLVECLGGFFAVCVYLQYGISLEALVYFVFIAVLLVITFIDLDHRIIPDVISLPGIVAFYLAAVLLLSIPALDALIGVLAGGGSLYIVAVAYQLLTGREGMGGGDIKLLAMIGALLGWKGVVFTIFVSSATGTLVGVAVMLATRKGMRVAVPFGPFLAVGAVTYIFFGPQLIDWYFNFLAG